MSLRSATFFLSVLALSFSACGRDEHSKELTAQIGTESGKAKVCLVSYDEIDGNPSVDVQCAQGEYSDPYWEVKNSVLPKFEKKMYPDLKMMELKIIRAMEDTGWELRATTPKISYERDIPQEYGADLMFVKRT